MRTTHGTRPHDCGVTEMAMLRSPGRIQRLDRVADRASVHTFADTELHILSRRPQRSDRTPRQLADGFDVRHIDCKLLCESQHDQYFYYDPACRDSGCEQQRDRRPDRDRARGGETIPPRSRSGRDFGDRFEWTCFLSRARNRTERYKSRARPRLLIFVQVQLHAFENDGRRFEQHVECGDQRRLLAASGRGPSRIAGIASHSRELLILRGGSASFVSRLCFDGEAPLRSISGTEAPIEISTISAPIVSTIRVTSEISNGEAQVRPFRPMASSPNSALHLSEHAAGIFLETRDAGLPFILLI